MELDELAHLAILAHDLEVTPLFAHCVAALVRGERSSRERESRKEEGREIQRARRNRERNERKKYSGWLVKTET